MPTPTAPLTADDLRRAIPPVADAAPCDRCRGLAPPGWESVAAPVGEPVLRRLGSLRDPSVDDPMVEEFHPAGTRYWSAEAPISVAHFPYNRCEVWQCPDCGRGVLQYTEFGGYYVDHRIRALDPARLA